MRIFIGLLVIVVSFFSVPSFAAPRSDEMKGVLNSYLKIQETLANDSLDQVQNEAAKIAKTATDKEIKSPAQSLAHDVTLEAARSDFKRLSIAMDKWAASAKPEAVQRMTCSMAKAPWLQKHGETKNPYYGKQMESCGEEKK